MTAEGTVGAPTFFFQATADNATAVEFQFWYPLDPAC
jgi:hypothetical protein